MAGRVENPFVFGEIVDQRRFVNRERELAELVRELADCQKVFLLSPRRFGKSSLVRMAFLKLQKQHIRCVNIPVSNYASYAQFLEKFAEHVLGAAGSRDWIETRLGRFLRGLALEVTFSATGDIRVTLAQRHQRHPEPVAAEVFALPGEIARRGEFQMAICLDEFQKIEDYDSGTVEHALRNAVQLQRKVGYVFAGSQPSLMERMLAPKRPFYKSGPPLRLDKIPAPAWSVFIDQQFGWQGRRVQGAALLRLFEAADLIPYDVQRLAHELWDYAELAKKKVLAVEDVEGVIQHLLRRESSDFQLRWQQLSLRQRAVLQALAAGHKRGILSQDVRVQYRLGPASSAQRALLALNARDVVDRYREEYFLLDPLFGAWIRRQTG